MGIGKSIEAYSIYESYYSDNKNFILNLSERLSADFSIKIYDKNCNKIEDRQTNYNKLNRYDLTITFDEYTILNKTIELPTYELIVPISYVYEESIVFIFHPNNLLHIVFLTFEHLWKTFIETLKFECDYEIRQKSINRYQSLRKEYKNLLNKIGVHQICITTDNHYKIENITNCELYNKLKFNDILQIVGDDDEFKMFYLQVIIDARNKNDLNQEFKRKSDLKIVFID